MGVWSMADGMGVSGTHSPGVHYRYLRIGRGMYSMVRDKMDELSILEELLRLL